MHVAEQYNTGMNSTGRGTLAGAAIGQGVREQSEVDRELTLLQDRISSLELVINALVSRLSPVIVPFPANETATAPAPACGSALGSQINCSAAAVLSLDRRLTETLKALAL